MLLHVLEMVTLVPMIPPDLHKGLDLGEHLCLLLERQGLRLLFLVIEEKGENVKVESATSPVNVLPPWKISQGMNLTREQRGEVKQESKTEGTSTPVSDVKKLMTGKDDVKNLQDEYVEAYYAALLQRQRGQEEVAKWEQDLSNANIWNGVYNTTSDCQVGMKSKHEDEDEGDDGVEWEEAPHAGNADESYKVNDLNVQADASGDDEDDVNWEEG